MFGAYCECNSSKSYARASSRQRNTKLGKRGNKRCVLFIIYTDGCHSNTIVTRVRITAYLHVRMHNYSNCPAHTLNSSMLASNRPILAAVCYEEAIVSSPQSHNLISAGPTQSRGFCLNIYDTSVVINLQSVERSLQSSCVLLKNYFL